MGRGLWWGVGDGGAWVMIGRGWWWWGVGYGGAWVMVGRG